MISLPRSPQIFCTLTLALLLALAACAPAAEEGVTTRPRSSPAPEGTGPPSPAEIAPAPGTPAPQEPPSPQDPAAAEDLRGEEDDEEGAEPDFSGTGCFPDIPTPVRVVAYPQEEAGRSGEPVRLVLEVHADEPTTVEHRHGQEFDFSVDRDGEEVWRWSTVAPFTDPYGYELTYRPGRVRRFSVVWDQAPWRDGAPAGDYVIHGFLIADMRSPPPEGRFICFDESPLRLEG